MGAKRNSLSKTDKIGFKKNKNIPLNNLSNHLKHPFNNFQLILSVILQVFNLTFTLILLIFLPLLFFLNPVSAELLSNKTYSGQSTITIDGDSYTLMVGDNAVTTLQLIKIDENETILLSEGNCKKIGQEQICNEKKIDNTTSQVSHYNLSAKVSSSITYGFEEDETWYLGDELNFSIKINNTGLKEANNVKGMIEIPKNVHIDKIKGCGGNDTHIFFDTDLRSNSSMDCEIFFSVHEEETINFALNGTYKSLGKNFVIGEETEKITIKEKFQYQSNITNATNIEPKKLFFINLNITNNNTDNLTIEKILVETGYDLEVEGIDTTKLKAYASNIRGKNIDLEENESLIASIELMIKSGNKSGKIPIKVTYHYEEENKTRTIIREYNYKSITKEPIINLITPKEIESELEEEISLEITNTYNYYKYRTYQIEIKGELLEEDYRVNLPYQKTRTLKGIKLKAPKVDESKQTTLMATIFLEEQDGTRKIVKINKEITITPIKTITLKKEYSQLKNGEINITLFATNNHPKTVEALFEEEGEFYVKGIKKTQKEIKPNETIQIYSYSILLTNELIRQDLNIKTNYEYEYNGEEIINENTITISKDQLELFYVNSTSNLNNLNEIDEFNNITNDLQKVNSSQNLLNDELINNSELSNQKNNLKSKTIIWVVISGVLALLIIIFVIKFQEHRIRRIYNFKIKHNYVLKKYSSILKKEKNLEHDSTELKKESQELKREIGVLDHYLKSYEREMPIDLKKISKEKEELIKKEEKTKKQIEVLANEIKKLQEQIKLEEQIDQEIVGQIRGIENRTEKLKTDEKNLQMDKIKLEEQIKENEIKQKQEKEEIEKLIKNKRDFKREHAKHYVKQLKLLKIEKDELDENKENLTKEEKLVYEEIKKVQSDLLISDKDMFDAETKVKELEKDTKTLPVKKEKDKFKKEKETKKNKYEEKK